MIGQIQSLSRLNPTTTLMEMNYEEIHDLSNNIQKEDNGITSENVTQAGCVSDNEGVKCPQGHTTSNDSDQNIQAAIKVEVCENKLQLNRCRGSVDIEHVTLCL